jgi:hypothetical protein
MLDMLRIRSCVLVAAMFASSLACSDGEIDPALELDMIEAEREPETGSSSWWMRVVDDQHDLIFVDDLELHIVIDPATLPKDIAGVGVAEATVEIGGPFGEPFKTKLKIVVMPAGPTAS